MDGQKEGGRGGGGTYYKLKKSAVRCWAGNSRLNDQGV